MKFHFSLFFILSLIIGFEFSCFSQNPVPSVKGIDSLYEVARINLRRDTLVSRRASEQILQWSAQLSYPQGRVLGTIARGMICRYGGRYDSAMSYNNKALAEAQHLQYSKGIILATNAIGVIHYSSGRYEKALSSYMEALKIAEATADTVNTNNLLNNIGIIYSEQKHHDKALLYFKRSLEIREKTGDKTGMAICLNNIADSYYDAKDTLRAIEIHQQSLQVAREIDDQRSIGMSLYNLGIIHTHLGKFRLADDFLTQALAIRTKLNNRPHMQECYRSMGLLHEKQGNLPEAIRFYLRALTLAQEMADKDEMGKLYRHLADVYSLQDNHLLSKQYYQKFISISEELQAENSARQMAEMQTRYESEKKEQHIALLQEQNQFDEFSKKVLAGGIALLGLLLAGASVGYYQKQKAHRVISQKNRLLEVQKEEIITQSEQIELQHQRLEKAYQSVQQFNRLLEQKNRKISDSINYAKRLQAAILPPVEEIKAVFPESFVLFKPRDVVSGDFYYFARHENKVILSAIDCTGHGVPGAFMSMIGYELLNQIILTDSVYEPSLILQRMHTGVVSALRQGNENSKSNDGMDMVLCSIDLEKRELQVAAAQNPLFLFNPRRGEEAFIEVKGDKRAIGGKYGRDSSFKNHVIALQDQDTVYFFSDGYADQFGGAENRKFMIKRFRQLLSDIQPLSMEQQKQVLEKELAEWMGNHEQVDDILVIGVRFGLPV